MRRRIHQLPAEHSHDTIACLEHLLEEARRGEIIGLAFAALCKRRKFVLDTAGEAHRNPTFARGMVAALDDAIGMRMREE
jgi:hypothetical protein